MKLKYYLRGMGIGIIVTTIILAISFSQRDVKISDAEVISRALELGMVMQDEEEPETAESETQELDINEAEVDETQNLMDVSATEQMLTEDEAVTTEEMSTEEADAGAEEPIPQEDSYRLIIKKGDVCRTVCEDLAANGIISDAEEFRKYLFEIGYANSMSVGEYEIPYGLTGEEVADILQAGPIEKE